MFTVEDMLNLKSFQGAQIIAGKEYIVNEVLNICVMEVPDITDYVKRGDFLITTLYPLVNNEDKMKSFISDLSKAGLSGIGIKLNRYVYNVPNHFIDQANFQKLPLVLLPENSNFSLQINEFLMENNNRKAFELEYRNKLHNYIMDIISNLGNYQSLYENMVNLLGKNMGIFDKDGKTLASSKINNKYNMLDFQAIMKLAPSMDYEGNLIVSDLMSCHQTDFIPCC